MLRVWQRLQHLDGHHDVVIDDLALALSERATSDMQIIDFVLGQERVRFAVRTRPTVLADAFDALLVFV